MDPGSQNLAYDDRTHRVIVVFIHEGGDDGAPRPLLAYDPVGDAWTDFGTARAMGYSRSMLLVDDLVLAALRNAPVAFRLPG